MTFFIFIYNPSHSEDVFKPITSFDVFSYLCNFLYLSAYYNYIKIFGSTGVPVKLGSGGSQFNSS